MIRPKRTELSTTNLLKKGVPKSFHKLTVEDLDDFGSEERGKIIDYIKKYISNLDVAYDNNVGLFMYGSNGVGKSFIASLIVKEAYRWRYSSKRCTFVDYITEYTRVWGIKDKDEKEQYEELFYNDYKSVEFLVIEEIGKEIDTKISVSVLEDCLRYREEKGLVTIICTNLPPKEIAEKYGQSIASLIKGNFRPIKLVGADKRQEVFNDRRDNTDEE